MEDLIKIFQKSNNIKEIKKALKDYPEENLNQGKTPLHLYLTQKNKKIEILEAILKMPKLNINAKNNETPLAVLLKETDSSNFLQFVEKLLKAGADPNLVSNSPLYRLSQHSSQSNELLELLLKYKINPTPTNMETALHYACYFKADLSTIQLLIDYGADVNAKSGYSPLHYECYTGPRKESILLLISKGSKINFQHGETALHFAIKASAPHEVIETLLDQGADPNIDDKSSGFSLICSSTRYGVETFEKMLQCSADIKSDKYNGKTPPLISILNHNNFLHLVDLFAKYGANFEVSNGDTPIIAACRQKITQSSIHKLLEFNVNVNAKNGKTALHYASSESLSTQILEDLILHGANIDEYDYNKTPLDYSSNPDVTQFLQSFSSLALDYSLLLERQELTDIEIETIDKTIHAHKAILQARFGTDINFNLALSILKKKTYKEVYPFIQFIYTGMIKGSIENLREISKEIGINFDSKIGRKGIVDDMMRLYEDESSKDFKIIVDDQNIFVHKFILLARSDLYRGMFINVHDESNAVTDYSGKSFQTLEALIKFLYLDRFDSNLSDEVIDELADASDFYQLNEKINLDLKLQESGNIINRK
ncbi:ankyrin repeat ph and sec7 domain containing protein secg-related [Anaeramoeba ignava]|uniref:Ankyrin repeat ph and sec7 domain containing protein secg-related n=1 Tax=Anaeramoeba ignava TaxID=1746090 RepID=A0A9Q0RHG8_ANAIG|nr:ankyrin repeat ph and sec7 domain containing protein secg-related [Anaeramoeba ignava]